MSKITPAMNIILCVLGGMFLLSGLTQARAEEDKPLTWMEAVVIAQKFHPDLLSAEEKLNQAKSDKALAKSGLFPQVSAKASSATSKVEGAKSTKSNSLSVSGQQLLFDGSSTTAGVKAAIENLKSAQYNLDVVSSNVRLNLRAAFVELLLAQEFLSLTEEIAKLRNQNVELVNLRYQAGREHMGSLLTTQADLAQAEFEVAQAKRQLELAQVRLNKELGQGKYKPVKVKGDFILEQDFTQKPDMLKLAEDNPFLKQLISKKEATRWGIESAKSQYFPQIFANGSAGKSDEKFLPEKSQWSAGLSFSLPLFEGGLRRAQLDKSQSAFRQSEDDLRSGKDSVIFTLEQAWANLVDSGEKVSVRKKFFDAAGARSKIAQAQYSNGLITFDDWTIIEDSLVNAKKSYLSAQADALTAEANWIQAKGGRINYEE